MTLTPNLTLKVSARSFQKLVKATIAADSGIRPLLAGVNLKVTHTAVKVACTDGYRVSVVTFPSPFSNVGEFIPSDFTLPTTEIKAISKFIGGTKLTQKPAVTIALDKVQNTAKLTYGDYTKEIPTLEVDLKTCYPQYEQLIPSEFVKSFKCKTKELKTSLKALLRLTPKSTLDTVVKLTFFSPDTSFNDELTLTTNSGEKLALYASPLSQAPPQPFSIALNVKFMLDALHTISTPMTSLRFNSDTTLAAISPLGDITEQHFLMPVKLHEGWGQL